ncbi:Glutathione S-transferase zeta-1 [Irineochytrium annulatum]|nr:Glutathione S-transferase zeta-1 [Irineochytrium annulatum]
MTSTSTPDVTLHGYWRSSASWRVRLALNLKGIPFKTVPVDLLNREQLTENFMKLNPNASVPLLKYGEHTITQSVAILEFLEEVHPNNALLPSDHYKRAQVRAIVNLICCDIHPIQNPRVIGKVGPEAGKDWARFWIARGFDALEKELAATAGKYCVGDEITMADLCLVPQVYNGHRFNVDFASYPNINRIVEALEGHEAFKKSHPTAQPDAPPS